MSACLLQITIVMTLAEHYVTKHSAKNTDIGDILGTEILMLYLVTPTMSVGVGRIFESVCLFVCSITQKRMIPKE